MSSREHILSRVRSNQPDLLDLPDIPSFRLWFEDIPGKFTEILTMIGGHAIPLSSLATAPDTLKALYPDAQRIVSNLPELAGFAEPVTGGAPPHSFEDVDLAVLRGRFGVAENGAIWVTESEATTRVLPFICQSLVLVIDRKDIVATMHDAYRLIGASEYSYGAFIAGPSKTADIEQSLVLGAHGPKSMSVLLLG